MGSRSQVVKKRKSFTTPQKLDDVEYLKVAFADQARLL
jgi:hypothetical protein